MQHEPYILGAVLFIVFWAALLVMLRVVEWRDRRRAAQRYEQATGRSAADPEQLLTNRQATRQQAAGPEASKPEGFKVRPVPGTETKERDPVTGMVTIREHVVLTSAEAEHPSTPRPPS